MKNKIIALLIVGLISLTGCGGNYHSNNVTIEDMTSIITNVEENDNWSTIEKCADIDMKQRIIGNLSSLSNRIGSDAMTKLSTDIYSDSAKAFTVDNISATVDGVRKKVYAIDYRGLDFDQYTDMIDNALTSPDFSSQFEKYRMNNLSYSPISYPTLNITLTKIDGTWKVENNDEFNEFINAMTGLNILKIRNDLSSSSISENTTTNNSTSYQYVWNKYPELTYDSQVMDEYMKGWVENLLVDNIDHNAKIAFVDLDMHKLMTWEDGFIPYGNGYEVAIYYPSTHMLQIGIEPKVDGDDYTTFFPFKVDNPVIGYAYDYSIIVQPSPDDAFYYLNGDRFEDGGSDVFDEATWYNIYV